ncbi:hypothetical protein L3476_26455 [Paenibacillus thiaminolyticus]|uniref:hypothetical protein n=1 Tax=Paenibacillus thiaminolyticus TaxID=49283 RepID=UPI00234FC750|nr:hypothetical protein [Paenibacillus thiaminolyticus]WCR26712.1 hypothetical protein L3476_26455 [Paenibacillus thiaminolyticus]
MFWKSKSGSRTSEAGSYRFAVRHALRHDFGVHFVMHFVMLRNALHALRSEMRSLPWTTQI